MDFWDLTKLLFRRWRVSVPLILVSIAVCVTASQVIKPNYSATSYFQLLPASLQPDAATATGPHNPWSDLGVEALGQAALTAVSDQDVLNGLVEQGFTDNVTVGMNGPTPIITITAIAKSPGVASSTDLAVVRLLNEQVAGLQSGNGLSSAQYITARLLFATPNVQKVNSKVIRAVLVVAAVCLLLSAALTVLIDVVLRRRAQSRERSEDDLPMAARGSARVKSAGSARVKSALASRRLWSVVGGRANPEPEPVMSGSARQPGVTDPSAAAPARPGGQLEDLTNTYSLDMTRIDTADAPAPAAAAPNGKIFDGRRTETDRKVDSMSDTEVSPRRGSDETIVLPALNGIAKGKGPGSGRP